MGPNEGMVQWVLKQRDLEALRDEQRKAGEQAGRDRARGISGLGTSDGTALGYRRPGGDLPHAEQAWYREALGRTLGGDSELI